MITSKELVSQVKSVVGSPYWYACFGQKPTEELLRQKIKQYPRLWTPVRIAKARSEIGRYKHAFDCVNLVKWACWPKDAQGYAKYQKAQDVNADGLSRISPGGTMDTLPETPGVLVFLKGHVGVYIGGGRVVEAYGFKNVADRPLSAQRWTRWGRCPWVEYPQEKPAAQPLSPFSVGDRVRVKPGATRWHPGTTMPRWAPGQEFTVAQVLYGGKPMKKGGELCVLLDRVNTWCAIKNLEKA